MPVLGGISEGKRLCACSCSSASAGIVASLAVLLAGLRAVPAPCPQASRAQSLHHPSDAFCCHVKALWWGGKVPWSSSSPPHSTLHGSGSVWGNGGVGAGRGESPKAISIGREGDWISTCLPKTGSAPFPIQGHQMRTAKSKTHHLFFTPFTYLGYIKHPIPHTLLLNTPFTLLRATILNVDLAHMIIEINISAI